MNIFFIVLFFDTRNIEKIRPATGFIGKAGFLSVQCINGMQSRLTTTPAKTCYNKKGCLNRQPLVI
jgi:hypothetical protein